MLLTELYQHKHYESLLEICFKMQGKLQWQELNLCALSLIHLHHLPEAILLLKNLLTLAPATMQVHVRLLLCHCFFLTEQWAKAESVIGSMGGSARVRPLVVRLHSYINWQQGKHNEAIQQLEEEFKLQKKAPATLLNILGYMLVDGEVDINRGYDYCHQALQIVPNYGPYLDSFGWACFKKGELSKARYLLEHAQLLLPENTEVKEHLSAVAGR